MNPLLIKKFITEEDDSVAWAFTDVVLSMVIIMLFYAVIFATLITNPENLNPSSTEVEVDTTEKKPTEITDNNYYGELGFPSAQDTKGFPTKESFNEDLIVTESNIDTKGEYGDLVWHLDDLEQLREKKTIRLYAQQNGALLYHGDPITVSDMRALIDKEALVHHVFVDLYIDETAPVKIYEGLREELWNESKAIHWKFHSGPIP